jgi:hypothetical protein
VTTGPDGFRCSRAARARGDQLLATAPPATRFLLVEARGPWGRSGLGETRIEHRVAGRLVDAAIAAGVRLLLIRRPGRHPDDGSGQGPGSWALADIRAGAPAVRWGTWNEPRELLELDLRVPLDPAAEAGTGPQLVGLVCTHGRHDVCCALWGRPVAQALAETGELDVWECSHLGGDRFAANLLLLPAGDLFGGLAPGSATAVARAYREGRLDLAHYRGRCGRPPVEQAAEHLAMAELGLEALGALQVGAVRSLPPEPPLLQAWTAEVRHGPDRYRLRLSARLAEPAVLTCAAAAPARARQFALERLESLAG